ncbi:hypothetical protein CAI21_21630 [Alkalilimnicola ehrlichii]|uniref:Uncharacterized protein n=1 Tax=Alkalilimnicola ehrlichii TaxID=351052 RepID=A0A3E0WQB3_9GAMM|nr:hypothetical protein [Alkalilimnicola ehrlichii]RFA24427.1 hypothetical protein CAI21_21630 [Alkalilimnicola ehrlichii]RFA35160.1 hypothetical protein CAL65_13735 [Alkalilimnicola ehrlichii]
MRGEYLVDETMSVYNIRQGATPRAIEHAIKRRKLTALSKHSGVPIDELRSMADRWGLHSGKGDAA